MLAVETYDRQKDAAVIGHGRDVFQRALSKVAEGAVRLHVKQDGKELYDLVYVRNNDILPAWKNNAGVRFLEAPDFRSYDLTDPGKLYLAIFEGYTKILFEEVNEYTVGLAQVLLRFTEMEVIFQDARALLFLDPQERLTILESGAAPAAGDGTAASGAGAVAGDGTAQPGLMRVTPSYQKNILDMDFSSVDAVSLFYNVFVWQSLTDRPFSDIRFVRLEMAYDEGIGSLLSNYTKCVHAFQPLGWKTVLKRGASR